MKKILSVFLCIVMCIPLCIHSFAQEVGSIAADDVKSSSRLGEFTVTVTASVKTELSSILLTLEYPDELNLSRIAPKLKGSVTATEITENENVYAKCQWKAEKENATGNFTLIALTFKLPTEVEEGVNYDINIYAHGTDKYGDDADLSDCITHVVISSEIVYGDANGDFKFNSKDISTLLRRIAGNELAIDLINADVNLDTKVNSKDVSAMLKVAAGWQTVRLGHSDITEVLVEANCLHKGKIRLTCTSCKSSVEIETEKTDHNYILGKCSVCGAKSENYPVIAYNDYLKTKGKFDADLRGYTLYESVAYEGYSVFESNICDSKTGDLCLFCVVNYDAGLSCTFSIETASVKSEYDFYYDCRIGDTSIATGTGVMKGDKLSFNSLKGDNVDEASHLTLANHAASIIVSYTDKLMKSSGLGLSVSDLKLK